MQELTSKSVLIVDDAAFSRRMLRKYVEAEGCQVLEARNGQEALDLMTQYQPDCILTDLLMPNIDGFELIKMLRDRGCSIPIAIISADIQDGSRQRGANLGSAIFINKPVKEAEVRQTVRNIILQSQGVAD